MIPDQENIADFLADHRYDFSGLVKKIFPWGEGQLSDYDGPDKWQEEYLDDFCRELEQHELNGGPVRMATASGHGAGKSSLVAWIVICYTATRPDALITVTANTERQLLTKTWRELAKWHNLSALKDLFVHEKTKYYAKANPETWFAAAIPWSEQNSEGFAGQHEKYTLVIMDEASGISDSIWEVISGTLTTPGAGHIAFGNPTRNSGMFYKVFHKLAKRWTLRQIDSRTCKMTDTGYLEELIEDWGVDSDYVRVRVLGQFPRFSLNQFFNTQDIEDALDRELKPHEYEDFPVVMGVDIARMGRNATVLCWRQGPKLLRYESYAETDGVAATKHIIRAATAYPAQVIFIDEVGVGGPIVDNLQALGMDNIVPVNGNWRSKNPSLYRNTRYDIYDSTRTWLRGADIPDSKDLQEDMSNVEFGITPKGISFIESKINLKARGLPSPDFLDALTLTFLQDVAPMDQSMSLEEMLTDQSQGGMGASEVTGY